MIDHQYDAITEISKVALVRVNDEKFVASHSATRDLTQAIYTRDVSFERFNDLKPTYFQRCERCQKRTSHKSFTSTVASFCDRWGFGTTGLLEMI